MTFKPASEKLRRQVLGPWGFFVYMLGKLPLGACAGLRLQRLDENACVVGLPGGWRTRNPFGSTYFAAQTMAAEMATGAPALVLVAGAPASVALILVEVKARFSRRVVGRSTFTFEDIAGLNATIDAAAASDEPRLHTCHVVGRGPDGEPASEFEIVWSFKRRRN